MNTRILIWFLLFLTIFSGCRRDFSAIDTPELTLTVEDVGVTEAWLRLETACPSGGNGRRGDRITVSRNDSVIWQANAADMDSLIYDAGLLPNHDYTYTASLSSRIQNQVSGLQMTTMDTTSHNFTWETFTFGDGGSSLLRDVFILNENEIWAVGEIWLKDSLDQFISPPFNAIHWDGNAWNLMRFYKSQNSVVGNLRGLWVVSDSVIWLAAGSIYYWDGNIAKISYQRNINSNETIYNLYISAFGILFGAGNDGLIVQQSGFQWLTLESNTELPIQDIWGTNNAIDEKKILYVASEKYEISEKKIFEIKPDNSMIELDYPFDDRLHSIWFNSSNIFYTAGDAVYRNAHNLWKKYVSLPYKFQNRIRGNDINDLFVGGDFGLISHYNGQNWYSYSDSFSENNLYYSLDFKNDMVVLVGTKGGREAVITLGKR